MCRVLVFEFFVDNVDLEEFKGKRILEVGSRYVNGSIRPFVEKYLKPKEYVGVDIHSGKFVDVVLPVQKLLEYFGSESFDVVISTETLEHIRNWRVAVNNIKGVVKAGGYVYITTVCRGYPFHSAPYDFWRWDVSDMERIFDDFDKIVLKQGAEFSILLKARKPEAWKPTDLSDIALYSVILGKRTKNTQIESIPLIRRLCLGFLAQK